MVSAARFQIFSFFISSVIPDVKRAKRCVFGYESRLSLLMFLFQCFLLLFRIQNDFSNDDDVKIDVYAETYEICNLVVKYGINSRFVKRTLCKSFENTL